MVGKEKSRNETNSADKDMADERASKSSAQGELDSPNQFTQREQQDHADDNRDSGVTNKDNGWHLALGISV